MLLGCIPLWIVEISPPHGRGMLGEVHGLMVIIGYLIANYTGVGFFYYRPVGLLIEWRGPLAIACLFPLITLGMLFVVPESPRWLLAHDREDEAFKIVQNLHRTTDDPTYEFARAEFYQMKKQMEIDSRLDSSWRFMWTRPSYRKRSMIACGVLSSIYSSGTLTITSMYLTYLLVI